MCSSAEENVGKLILKHASDVNFVDPTLAHNDLHNFFCLHFC